LRRLWFRHRLFLLHFFLFVFVFILVIGSRYHYSNAFHSQLNFILWGQSIFFRHLLLIFLYIRLCGLSCISG